MAMALATALDAIQKALAVDVAVLKDAPAGKLQELRDASDALTRKLDSVAVKATPSREGIHQILEGLAGKKWSGMKQLCDECLLPLMAGQVEMAMQAEEPALVLDMLIPMINFFNDFQFDLDDSKGAGAVFLQDWTTILSDALDMLDSSGQEQDRSCLEELLQAVQGFQAFDSEAMAGASERLEARMSQYQEDDGEDGDGGGGGGLYEEDDGGFIEDDEEQRPSKQPRRA